MSSPSSPEPEPQSGGGPKGGQSGQAPKLNKALQMQYDKGRTVARSAQVPSYAAALLAKRGITPQKVAVLLTLLARMDALSQETAEGTVNKLGGTLTEAEARQGLESAMKEIQGAAHQKYFYTDKIHLRLYKFNLRCNRKDLENLSNNAITQAGKDGLPGMTPEKLQAAALARQNYMDTDAVQLSAVGDGMTKHALLEGLGEEIRAARGEIQFAADTEWPHSVRAHAGVRKEFLLPAKSAFWG